MTSPELEKRLAYRSEADVPRHPNVVERLLFILILCGVPTLAIALLYTTRQNAFFGTPFGWFFVGVIDAAGILYVVIGSLGNLAYRTRVRKVGRADLVFRFSTSRRFRDEGAALAGGRLAALESSRCAVSASTAGLVVWAGAKPQRIAVFRWADVHGVTLAYVNHGTRRRASHRYGAQIEYTDKWGSSGYMTFVNANVDLVPLPSKAAAAYVVAELNRLRAIGNTAARP